MVPPSSPWYVVLDTLADSVDPMLAFAAIVAALRNGRRSSWRVASLQLLGAALGLAGIYAARAAAVALAASQHAARRYSTHGAFAASLVVTLAFWFPARRGLLAAILLCYLALMVFIGYHSVFDVVVASVVGGAVTAPWHLALRRCARNQQPAR